MSAKATTNQQPSAFPRAKHTFVGFGFGPIQAGLFAKEAFQSGNFERIIIAEIDRQLVEAVRSNRGTYCVNVARSDRIEVVRIEGVELLNPSVPEEAAVLRTALTQATEIATCLPSVRFYDSAQESSVATLIAAGLEGRRAETTIVYAAENHNQAAEILEQAVARRLRGTGILPLKPFHGRDAHATGTDTPPGRREFTGGTPMLRLQFLNTVIGKMSHVVTDRREITERGLTPIAPGIDRAFVVEEFNRILVDRTALPGFTPGIRVFIEKDNLLPFEEAKLYGHNAIHALLGFIGLLKGCTRMTELADDGPLMNVAREAFQRESGGALVRKYASLGDELFTEAGYRRYAEDLLKRMTNPYLADTVARAGRDVVRKLGTADRIFGTMHLALEQGIEPRNMALGALAGVALLLADATGYGLPPELRAPDWRHWGLAGLTRLLTWLWQSPASPSLRKLIHHTHLAAKPLAELLSR